MGLLVLVSFAALVVVAAPAAADAGDYLAELNRAGVSYSDPTDATNAGQSICQRLDKGESFDAAIDSETAAVYSEHDAEFIVGAAVKNLCPDLVPALNQWLQKPKPP